MKLSRGTPHKQSSGTFNANRRVPILDAVASPQRVTCPSVLCVRHYIRSMQYVLRAFRQHVACIV